MKNNMMVKAIEAVLKTGEVVLCDDVSFKLTHCVDHYYGEDIYRLHVIRNSLDEYSRSYEYLLKWNEEEGRFMTSSEF